MALIERALPSNWKVRTSSAHHSRIDQRVFCRFVVGLRFRHRAGDDGRYKPSNSKRVCARSRSPRTSNRHKRCMKARLIGRQVKHIYNVCSGSDFIDIRQANKQRNVSQNKRYLYLARYDLEKKLGQQSFNPVAPPTKLRAFPTALLTFSLFFPPLKKPPENNSRTLLNPARVNRKNRPFAEPISGGHSFPYYPPHVIWIPPDLSDNGPPRRTHTRALLHRSVIRHILAKRRPADPPRGRAIISLFNIPNSEVRRKIRRILKKGIKVSAEENNGESHPRNPKARSTSAAENNHGARDHTRLTDRTGRILQRHRRFETLDLECGLRTGVDNEVSLSRDDNSTPDMV
ncbi:hypothetical protein EVAR_25920_1 [Eumeta japonica]|uniref:Uncharacterized protein n=1 Tax=Eumeta variegata TaxID=151549 RepID=A0A4C1W4W5_EUMVA|nr:hypothetical protein EVAR_25920_1 [Eumeta japonica]